MHKSVLLKESIGGLNIKPGDTFLDGTVGSGGHSEYVCSHYGREVKIIGLDVDQDSLEEARNRLQKAGCNTTLHLSNFRELDKILGELKVKNINALLLDLGVSSYQFEKSGRGFSFQRDEPLLMTMKKEITPNDITAKNIVNTWEEKSIADVIYGYGEERYARKIAREIVERRKEHPIETTLDLVRIVSEAVPAFYKRKKIHPATKTFQALRIAVNDELGALDDALKKGFQYLAHGGRMAIISFHSLEDRIVKRFFKEREKEQVALLVTKKPITPTEEEIQDNPRSRSAKLRIIEKL